MVQYHFGLVCLISVNVPVKILPAISVENRVLLIMSYLFLVMQHILI